MFPSRAALAPVGAIAVAFFYARGAAAYCRTTTVPFDASADDPSRSGQCWTPGTDIAWPSGRVPYGVSAAGSKYFTANQVIPILDQAFAKWNAVSCDGRPLSVEAYDVGLLTYEPDGGRCSNSSECDATAHDVVVFDDAAWPHDDANSTLALTTVTYGVDDGRLLEAYTEVNTAQYSFSLAAPPPAGSFDLESVLTHEAGHFLGLAHSTLPTAVMWAFYGPDQTQLTADDQAAICATYPPKASGGGCRSVPGTAFPGMGIAIGAPAFVALYRRRRRTRND